MMCITLINNVKYETNELIPLLFFIDKYISCL